MTKQASKKQREIWALFGRLRPIIIEKLLNPEDKYVRSGAAQLVVPLSADEAENLSPEESFTALPTPFPNIWNAYPDERISLPWEGWATRLIISLKTDDMRKYRLIVSLTSYGCEDVVSHGQAAISGTIAQVAKCLNASQFPSNAASVFDACREAVGRKIEESEEQSREARLFANTDIADYDSVMRFVDSLNDKSALKSKGHGIELFAYDRVVALVDRSAKRVSVLVGRDGKALFCRLDDFPAELLDMIRRDNKNWDLGVYELSVGRFDGNGQALVTWVISPYYYCPMDEDGFGEEEEYEVAVTCHIDTEGRLTDTPAWKPYTGPWR